MRNSDMSADEEGWFSRFVNRVVTAVFVFLIITVIAVSSIVGYVIWNDDDKDSYNGLLDSIRFGVSEVTNYIGDWVSSL